MALWFSQKLGMKAVDFVQEAFLAFEDGIHALAFPSRDGETGTQDGRHSRHDSEAHETDSVTSVTTFLGSGDSECRVCA